MKNYLVTVNGTSYEVAVEEITNSGVAASAPKPAVQASPVNLQVAPASSNAAGIKVISPMPGLVVDIKVTVGQKVVKDQVVAVLEAMKMENDIVSPIDGTIAAINTTKGANLNSSDIIMVIN